MYGGGIPIVSVVILRYYSSSKKNNYIVRPPTFSGYSTEFEWWKIKH